MNQNRAIDMLWSAGRLQIEWRRRSAYHVAVGIVSILLFGFAAAEEAKGEGQESKPAPAQGPHELLDLLGAGPDVLSQFVDGKRITGDELHPLLEVLYAVRRSPPADLERFARSQSELERVTTNSDALRGDVFWLSGRVHRAYRELPTDDEAEQFEMPQFFRCELTIGDPPRPAIVYTTVIPRGWPTDEPIDERVGGLGVLLKFAEAEGDATAAILAADRLAWHPESELGRLGMDVGLLDHIEQRSELSTGDREAFYQMLAAVKRVAPAALFERAKERQSSVVPLFNDPSNQVGRLVVLNGTARRAQRIQVEDPALRARFGIDHYYEIEMFTVDSEGNPITVCVPDLPSGMPQGDDIRQDIRAVGFFFKVWAYRSAGSEPESRQLAPLLIAARPQLLEPEASSPYVGAIAGALFLVFLLGLWVVLWRVARRDRLKREQLFAGRYQLEPGATLDELAERSAPEFDAPRG